LLAPIGSPWNRVGETNAEGVLELAWQAQSTTAAMALAVFRSGRAERGLLRVDMSAGRTHELRIPIGHRDALVREALADIASVRDEDESPAPSDDSSAWRAARRRAAHRIVSNDTPLAVALSSLPRAVPERGTKGEQLLRFLGASAAAERDSGVTYDGPPTGEPRMATPETAQVLTVRGVVLDAKGVPAAGVPVFAPGPRSRPQAITGSDGHYELSLAFRPQIRLAAGGGDWGTATEVFQLGARPQEGGLRWSPRLERGAEVRGRIRVEGANVAGNWIVEATQTAGERSYGDLAVAREGRFALPNLPVGACRLALSSARSWPFVIAEREAWAPDVTGVDFELGQPLGDGGAVEVQLIVHESDARSAEVQLWQLSSGRGVWLEYDEESGVHRRKNVPPGVYSILAGNVELGYTALGEIDVGEGELVALGQIALDPPAHLRVHSPAGARDSADWSFRVFSSRFGIPVLFTPEALSAGTALDLPAGAYTVRAVGPQDLQLSMSITLTSGETRVASLTLPESAQ